MKPDRVDKWIIRCTRLECEIGVPFSGVAHASNTRVGLAHGGSCVRIGAGTRGGTVEAAGKCPALPHPIDRRQARRLLELGRGRRRSHGPGEHESSWSGVRGRLEWQHGGRRPAVSHHDPRRDAAGRRGRNLHRQRWDGRLEEPHRRRHCELFGPRVLRVARWTD